MDYELLKVYVNRPVDVLKTFLGLITFFMLSFPNYIILLYLFKIL